MLKIVFAAMASCCIVLLAAQEKGWSNVPDITDRKFWEAQKNIPGMDGVIKQAEKEATQEIESPLPNYLDFSKDGNRSRYEAKFFKLHWMGYLAVAACVTGEQKYIDYIEARVKALAALPTWVLPAHDRQLENYNGKVVDIDLAVATQGGEMACVLRMLSPALTPETKTLIESELMRRIIVPLEDMMNGKRKENWWLTTRNNWNSVCLSGMAAVVLRMDLEPERRARLVDYILKRSENFLMGFGKDGYCSEGISYWSYGFGYYMRMAADFRQATDGKIDLMSKPEVAKPARFAENIQLAPGVFPAFADSTIEFRLSGFIVGLQDYLENKAPGFPERFTLPKYLQDATLVLSLPRSRERIDRAALPPFSEFGEANVYIARPGTSKSRLAVAFKGGSNDEYHNHNDVGSYVIAVDGVPAVLDPGSEVYTRRTFSAQRYESKLINSYGHGVPVIGGQLQTEKGRTKSTLRLARHSEDGAEAGIDMTAPYHHVEGVAKVFRDFNYSRQGSGTFTITDTAEFSRALDYENAVISLGSFEQINDREFRITEKGKTLRLTIDCGDEKFTTSVDVIRENTHHKRDVNRLAIKLSGKVKSAQMTLTFIPEN